MGELLPRPIKPKTLKLSELKENKIYTCVLSGGKVLITTSREIETYFMGSQIQSHEVGGVAYNEISGKVEDYLINEHQLY